MSEMLFNRIKETAKRQKNMNVKEVGLHLGFGENAIYTWKKSNPSIDKIEKVSDFLKVSTDYLLGRTDIPNIISPDEQPSMAKQVMMRMDTNGLSDKQLDEIESEMERFFKWRLEEIKRERNEE